MQICRGETLSYASHVHSSRNQKPVINDAMGEEIYPPSDRSKCNPVEILRPYIRENSSSGTGSSGQMTRRIEWQTFTGRDSNGALSATRYSRGSSQRLSLTAVSEQSLYREKRICYDISFHRLRLCIKETEYSTMTMFTSYFTIFLENCFNINNYIISHFLFSLSSTYHKYDTSL